MGNRRVFHYSHDPKLDTIDPAHYGKNKSISPEYKQGHEHMAPRSYVYDTPERHEGVVTRGRHKHEAYLPNDWHIYDIGQDPDKIINNLQTKTGLQGNALYDALEHELKSRGIHGYKNSASPLNNVVALFHPLKVHRAASHAHGYDWHDSEDPMAKAAPVHPHLQAHGDKPVNEQTGGVGLDTVEPIMSKFGTITPGKKTNLKFYQGLEHKHDDIMDQVKSHGYGSYFAGGKYGKPDLANKNYNTGHLMVFDPTPQSGGGFGDEKYTSAWRHSHELAHALTHPQINAIYGEGRRLGKLGQRTPNEAKRAVHWEFLAAHKQRDLMAKLGHHISDADFNKELNTIMADATHRAIHGKFTEPSELGFDPHSHKPDLRTALNMIDEHAKKLGLQHDHDTLDASKQRQKMA